MDSVDSDFEEEKPQKKPRKSVQGRQLMRWNPDVDQLLLLTVDHVCVKNAIPIPWDEVGKHIKPYLTGEAIKQHLAKVRHFRVENDRPVPEKLEKGARRKAKLAATIDPTTPAKGSRAKKIKNQDTDDEDGDTPIKGASLLWYAPPKKTKTPKSGKDADPNTPATSRRSGGRKKATMDSGSGESFKDTATSTGKRGRKKQTVKKEDEDDMAAFDSPSPTKKPKTTSLRQQQAEKSFSLRPKEEIDYNDHADSDIDILDAHQDNDDDETYEEEMQWSQQGSTMKNTLDSSQGSTAVGNVPPPPFMGPDNTGYHMSYPPTASPTYAHPNNGGLFGLGPIAHGQSNHSGLPNGLLEQWMYTNGINHNAGPMAAFNSFGGNNGLLPNMTGHYGHGAYASEMPNLNDYNDPRREQDLRNAINQKLTTVPEEVKGNAAAIESKEKVKIPHKKDTPRKKATPKAGDGSAAGTPKKKKRTPKAGTLKGNEVAITGATYGDPAVLDKYEPVMKTESAGPSASDDVFTDTGNTSGTIPIANDTGYGHEFGVGCSGNTATGGMDLMLNTTVNQGHGAYAHEAFNFNDMQTGVTPAHNPYFNQAPPDQFAASPIDIFNGDIRFSDAHTGVTPQINKFNLEYPINNSFNSQLSQYPSHSSSFSSIQPSQSIEAPPGFDQAGSMNFEQAWDPNAYEQQSPDDKYANMGDLLDPNLFSYES